jgi:hypothetical protein
MMRGKAWLAALAALPIALAGAVFCAAGYRMERQDPRH